MQVEPVGQWRSTTAFSMLSQWALCAEVEHTR
jgi:hypothetical protein